jgi:hypothetical protein
LLLDTEELLTEELDGLLADELLAETFDEVLERELALVEEFTELNEAEELAELNEEELDELRMQHS